LLGLFFSLSDFTFFLFFELVFERLNFDVHISLNFVTNFALLIFLVSIPLLFLSLDFIFVLLYQLLLFKQEVSVNLFDGLLELLLVQLLVLLKLLFCLSTNKWVLDFVVHNSWHHISSRLLLHKIVSICLCRDLLSWLLLLLLSSSWVVWSTFILRLELQELLPVLFIERMIVHLLAGYRVDVENLVVLVEVCLPWLRHWCFQPFFSDEQVLLILLNINSKELGVPVNFLIQIVRTKFSKLTFGCGLVVAVFAFHHGGFLDL